ncbi:hypothetical protein ACA910_006827 [Epithemia clementina (nom. ined.)]
MAERHQPAAWYTANDAFEEYQSGGLKTTVLKEVLDPTVKGQTCPPPRNLEVDAQWRKFDWKQAGLPVKAPSVFSTTKFVQRRLTTKELGRILDFPLEVVKGNDGVLVRWLEFMAPIPFKIRTKVIKQLYQWLPTGYQFKTETDWGADGGECLASMPVFKQQSSEGEPQIQMTLKLGEEASNDIPCKPAVKAAKADDAEVPE